MVSIVVPVYNTEKYLNMCIKSLVEQSEKDIEIILINDGSTDRSLSICEDFQKRDSRIRIISKENEGLGRARNTGLEAAHGEYITFVDSDDWLHIDFIKRIIEAMKRDNADIGLCDINYIDAITLESEISKIRMRDGLNFVSKDKSLLNKARTFAWGKIYKRVLFEENQIRYPNIIFEDIPCTSVLVALSERITYVPLPLCNYRRNVSESLSLNPNNIKDLCQALVMLQNAFVERKLLEKFSIELKKIYIGQMRFAVRRWGDCKDNFVQKELDSLIERVQKLDSSISNFDKLTFYVKGNSLLEEALSRVVIWKKQLVQSNDILAIEVSYTNSSGRKSYIRVNDNKNYRNEEEQIWDYAEQIMEKVDCKIWGGENGCR